MFIKIAVFSDTDFHEMKAHQPFLFTYIRNVAIYNTHSKDNSYPVKTITFNTDHIVNVIPINYHYRYSDGTEEPHDGFLIIDSNNNQFVSPVPDLDKKLMEFFTQQFNLFTFDVKE